MPIFRLLYPETKEPKFASVETSKIKVVPGYGLQLAVNVVEVTPEADMVTGAGGGVQGPGQETAAQPTVEFIYASKQLVVVL